MSSIRFGPPDDVRVAAIHATDHDQSPVGSAVVIGSKRVLACADFVVDMNGTVSDGIWMSFPKSPARERRHIIVAEVAYNPWTGPGSDCPSCGRRQGCVGEVKEASPEEVAVKFGLKASGQANWFAAKTVGEGNCEVSLIWSHYDCNDHPGGW